MTTTTKKERAIPMVEPLALATRNGTKTETRRMFNPNLIVSDNANRFKYHGLDDDQRALFEDLEDIMFRWLMPVPCPYGQVGDVLWIREPYYAWGRWQQDGHTRTGRLKYKFVDRSEYSGNEYKYSDNPPSEIEKNGNHCLGWYKRLARFMPKAACRTKVEIVGIAVERLNDITAEGATAEGIELLEISNGDDYSVYPRNYLLTEKTGDGWPYFNEGQEIESFKTLWQSINGPNSWNENPFVWVVKFKLLNE